MEQSLNVERRGRVAHIVLNRPPVNALGPAELDLLADTLRALAADDTTSVVVLRSALPGVFSAGFDLKANTSEPATGVNMPRETLKRIRDAQWAVLDCPLPIIVAAGGFVLGLGFMLSSLCDIIIASRSATFGFPEINFGLGGAGHARRALPEPVLRYLMLSGRRVPASYLAQFGAVALVVEDDELEAAASGLAEEIAGYDPMVVRNMKVSLEQLKALDVRSTYAVEHIWSGLMGFQRKTLGTSSPVDEYMQRFRGDGPLRGH